jgi:Acyl-CoA carboxylase epsilon subunit
VPQDPSAANAGPLLSVVRGKPDAAELAAVIVVLTGRASRIGTSRPSPQRPQRGWSARAAMMRPRLAPGSGAWRASALP